MLAPTSGRKLAFDGRASPGRTRLNLEEIEVIRYALLAAALLFGATAYAGGPGCKHGAKMEELTADLNLDATQAAQVEEILKAQHDRMRTEHKAIHEDTLTQLRGILTEEQIQTLQARWERHGHKSRDGAQEGV
jgi:hypothetical protein